MAEIIQKYLSQKDADDAKKIVNDINTAKDPEQSVDGYVRLDTTPDFDFDFKTPLHLSRLF